MPKSRSSSGSEADSKSSIRRREVDYYLNPTELFRWINYRRWDGAKARAESHPEEVSTWIASKTPSDGKTLWRHLPLHLVCMQSLNPGGTKPSGNSLPSSNPLTQLEELVDTLITVYPEAVAQSDEQGMLPLHLAVSNGATERIINLLLLSHPPAVDAKDKFGRTAMDILHEMPPSQGQNLAAKALLRAKDKIERLASTVRDESALEVAKVQKSAANERVASQRIIMRLEEELEVERKNVAEQKKVDGIKESNEKKLKEGIVKEEMKYIEATKDYNSANHEREILRKRLDEANATIADHNRVVQSLKQDSIMKNQKQERDIAKLRSDVATAKAMSDAMEEQLRARFAQEESLTNTVETLELDLSKAIKMLHDQKKLFEDQTGILESEIEHLRTNIEDLNRRNTSYQNRISELNSQVSNLLAAQASMQAEHDRLIEASARYESELLESLHIERGRYVKSISKQKKFYESVLGEQEQILTEAAKKERDVLADYSTERERSILAVEHLTNEFKNLHAAERERMLKQNTSMQLFPKKKPTINSPLSFGAEKRILSVTSFTPSNTVLEPIQKKENPSFPPPKNLMQPIANERHDVSYPLSNNSNIVVQSVRSNSKEKRNNYSSKKKYDSYPSPDSVLSPDLIIQPFRNNNSSPHEYSAFDSPNSLNSKRNPVNIRSPQPVDFLNEKGFELNREETPPFEIGPPPGTPSTFSSYDRRRNFDTRRAPVLPSSTTSFSDYHSDNDNPGPVRSGNLLRILENRAEKHRKRDEVFVATSSGSAHEASSRTRTPTTRDDVYSQSSSPSSVTGYAYRSTRRTRKDRSDVAEF